MKQTRESKYRMLNKCVKKVTKTNNDKREHVGIRVRVMVFNANFNNISAMLW
jgi:hypothetical protein